MGLYYIAGVVEPVGRGCIVDVCDASVVLEIPG